MKDRKTKTALKVVHRNDRAQIKRLLEGSGQALLPMLELLEGAQASIDELMHDAAVAVGGDGFGFSAKRRQHFLGGADAFVVAAVEDQGRTGF